MTAQRTPAPRTQLSDDDLALRRGLRDALAGSSADDTQALQSKVVAQWQQRRQASQASQASLAIGPLLALRLQWRRHPALSGGALLALGVAGVLWLAPWNPPDTTAEELKQLDVLSLMSMGEL